VRKVGHRLSNNALATCPRGDPKDWRGEPPCAEPFGLAESHIQHDNFMLFQPGFIGSDGSGNSVPSQYQPGDFPEIYADMNLIAVVSTCPAGDYAVPMMGPGKITTRSPGFEIYEINTNAN